MDRAEPLRRKVDLAAAELDAVVADLADAGLPLDPLAACHSIVARAADRLAYVRAVLDGAAPDDPGL